MEQENKKCCEKCLWNKKGCSNPNCECHQPTPQTNWEEEFDKALSDKFWMPEFREAIKHFISNLLLRERSKIVEWAENKKIDDTKTILIEYEYGYNQALEDLIEYIKK